jgi:hypothetical protein
MSKETPQSFTSKISSGGEAFDITYADYIDDEKTERLIFKDAEGYTIAIFKEWNYFKGSSRLSS